MGGANGTVGNYNYFTFTATSTNVPVTLQSSWAIDSGFADDNSALANLAAKTITVPRSSSTRFYRLRSAVSTQMLSIRLVGTNVVLRYQ